MQSYRIKLLGKLEVQAGETVIARFRTRKTALLLAYLAYHSAQPAARDVLIESLWPELDCDAARNNLSTALSSLRRQLEPPGITPGAILAADRHAIQLRPGAVVTDVTEFEQALRAAQRVIGEERESFLKAALQCYGGSLLPDYEADWIRVERLHLEQSYQEARRQWEALQTSQDSPSNRALDIHVAGSPVRTMLPVGTVTFVAIGWGPEAQQHRVLNEREAAFGAVISAIVQRECRRSGGVAIDSEADTLVVCFASAAEALEYTLDCRRTLAAQPLGNAEEAAPRIALHIGELQSGEDLNCSPVHALLLKLLAAAQPGQTLSTSPLIMLFGRIARSGARWKDLGEYRLTEGRKAERIFQIEAAEKPECRFPPLRAPRLQTETLPQPLDRFFGRENDLTQIMAWLDTPDIRLVTLTGMGGAGKTRLAVEVGHRIQATFPGLVWFVPLASLEGAELLSAALCRALNLSPRSHTEPFAQACEFLNRQESRTLLILDNFEPFIEEGAEWVERLLIHTRNVACLLTSRQALELPGEQQWPVPPLPLPLAVDSSKLIADRKASASHQLSTINYQLTSCPSVQLFVNRAQAVKPDFQVTPGNADCIAQLCIALEGIPLAIELATARTQVMTPTEMLTALQNRFDFLTTQRRSILPRHRALRATIDWSYERLRPELQRFFAQLSVFRDGWTAQEAAETCDAPYAREWLMELRARSFVLAVEKTGMAEMCFYALETLREYGAEMLKLEDKQETQKRHLDCFLRLAEAAEEHLHGPDQAQWLERLEAKHANLRAALAWSLSVSEEGESALRLTGALWSFFQIRGYVREGRGYLRAALAHGSVNPTRARAQALNGAGALAQIQGDYAEARIAYSQSLEIWKLLGHAQGIASALNNMGLIAELQGDYEEAQTLYEQGLAIREQLKDRQGLAASYNNLGILMQMRRKHAESRSWYERSLELKRELQQWQGVASTLNNLGNMAHALRDYDASRAYHEESMAIRQRLGDKQGIAGSLNNLGMLAESVGDYELAQDLYVRSLAIKQELGDRQGAGMTLHNLGTLARLRGDLDIAHDYCCRSLKLHYEIGDRHGMAGGLQALAAIANAQGHSKRSARLYAAQAALCNVLGMTTSEEEQAELQRIAAELRAKLGTGVFAQEQAVGIAFTLEQAVAYALENT